MQLAYYNNLDKINTKIWNMIKEGVTNRHFSFHIPIMINAQENQPDGRIVVLRGVSQKEKKIWFHSDIRSIKIKTLKTNSLSSFLFYDKAEKIQLRISCDSKINYQNEITKNAWKKTVHMSRQCYLGEKGPGSISTTPTSGLSKNIDDYKYSIEESEIGYKNFCLVENFINTIEWLYLAAKGHRRACFNIKNNSLEKKWLIP